MRNVINHPSPYQLSFEFLAVASTFGTTTSYTVIIAGLTSWLFQHIWWAGCLVIADEDWHWLGLLQVKVALTLVLADTRTVVRYWTSALEFYGTNNWNWNLCPL